MFTVGGPLETKDEIKIASQIYKQLGVCLENHTLRPLEIS